jgi:16S rRNA (guanine(966)-N(2))-methyltransferase RsmD
MIRVIGGIYKGKRLRRVPSVQVRPMPDKLKEALFSILQDEVKESIFLDGFSGTGSIGIEALSRRAKFVVFVDQYYPAIKVIKANVAKCGAEDDARVMHKEFNRAVIQLSKESAKFNLIILDPPYKMLEERNPLKVIKKREILAEKGKIVLRHFYKTKFDGKYFNLERRVNLGDDTLLFYR